MGDVESRDYEAACFKEKEYARRAVDSVIPGDSESEEVHQLTGEDHLDGAQKSLDDNSVGEIMWMHVRRLLACLLFLVVAESLLTLVTVMRSKTAQRTATLISMGYQLTIF